VIDMRRAIFLIIILFLKPSLHYCSSIDSAHRILSFNFNKRSLNAVDRDKSPFSDCHIYSLVLNVQKRLYTNKSFNINTSFGLTIQNMHIGRINPIVNFTDINENVNANSLALGWNSGISLEKNILKIRNSRVSFAIGLWSNGIFRNAVKSKVIVHERNDIFGKDSVVIQFKKNSNFYVNTLYQLTFKSKVKNTIFVSGLKLIHQPMNGFGTNIEYQFFRTNISRVEAQTFRFVDTSPQLFLFFGICF
jgi:hypothetical protein